MKTLPVFDLLKTPLAPGTTLIEASAGTGKTFTIAGLFLRLLLERELEVTEILVTTYTKAATAELRDRIRRRLIEARAAFAHLQTTSDPFLIGIVERHSADAAIPRLDQALRNFDEAAIFTIHGFCQRLLQDRAFESGLPFSAELLADELPVIQEVAEDFWRIQLYERDPVLTALALHGKVTMKLLVECLRNVANKPVLRIHPPAGRLAAVQAEIASIFADLRRCWASDREEISRYFTEENGWASGSCHQGNPAKMELALAALHACLTDCGPPLSAFGELEKFRQSGISRATKKNQTTPQHCLFDLCERLAPLREEYLSALLSEFVDWGREELLRRKGRRNVHSFDDLLTRLDAALRGPTGNQLAALIRSRYQAALIDEFQDTDALQETSFRRIFRGAPERFLYLIGDPKQAIYAFRGADVFTYLAAADRADAGFTLDTNHRAENALVEGVNAIFRHNPNAFALARIQFREARASGRLDTQPLEIDGQRVPPLRIAWCEPDEQIGASELTEELPLRTAAEIARMLAGGVTIGGRPVAPKDFAVLVASHWQASAVHTALAALGVPAVLHANADVFESLEAADLQALLAAVVEPAREDLIRAALATAALGLNACELDALGHDEAQWEATMMRFHSYHETWRLSGFIQMFRQLLQREHVRPRLLGFPDGERRLTNLLHLADLVHQACSAQRLSMGSLVKWLADQRALEAPASEEREQRLERDEHAVQVVTVHKSKGLQYNIVFCPYLWSGLSSRSDTSVFFHGPDDALVLDLCAGRAGESWVACQRERLAEKVRLLYVAMTRARHRCHVIWGPLSKVESGALAWLLHPLPHGEWERPPGNLQPAQMRAELEQLVASAPGALALDPLWPLDPAPRWTPPTAHAGAFAARTFAGHIPRDWRIASFSSLTAAGDAAPHDFDQTASVNAAPEALSGIHAFPRGPRAGVCLHELFEKLDFSAPEEIDGLVARKLEAYGFDSAEARVAVAQCVRQVLRVPLDEDFTLDQVASAQRLNELEFYFPFQRLAAAELARHFGPLPTGIGRVQFDPQQGFIRGFIDLVCEHRGRFYILDWKSNWLGRDTASYHPEAMRAEMLRHHYVLQYAIYSVALHRYLARRLPGYEYAAHFGGVRYLFLRGVEAARPELGVYRDRLAQDFVEELSALFAGKGRL